MDSFFSGISNLFYLTLLVLVLWMQFRILNKAGYSGWWTFITIIPIVNLIAMYVFSFHRWPVEGADKDG